MAHLSFKLATIAAVSAYFRGVSAQAAAWAQCGGIGFTGPTTCVTDWCCIYLNAYHSQCLQEDCPTGSSLSATATSTATTPIVTLSGDLFWMRSVVQPYFHKYLQSVNGYAPGDAILGNNTGAGEFWINQGQLALWIPSSSGFLYANVDPPANSSVTYTKMYFAPTPNTFGQFAYPEQGLNIMWANTTGPVLTYADFVICQDATGHNVTYLNLGTSTPPGCGDTAISYYNGGVADP
ncbi:hypothetical protein FRB95_014213 [Tulasnella sp. JGI-2019a]|nr:hypothetical protein FRB95_014213 [Tulasnella sp. JGI-2019a]